jgi:hypothetical protein
VSLHAFCSRGPVVRTPIVTLRGLSIGDDLMTEVRCAWHGKLHFLGVQLHPFLADPRKGGPQMCEVLLKGLEHIDNNIINKALTEQNHSTSVRLSPCPLKERKCVFKANGHNDPFLQTIWSPEGCFATVLLRHFHLVVAPSKVKGNKPGTPDSASKISSAVGN